MKYQLVFVWSIISNMEAIPREINPKGIKKKLFKCLKLLIDFKPKIIGINMAWRWAMTNIM